MKKIAITGSMGMLGQTLVKNLKGFELIPLTIENCDITQGCEVEKAFVQFRPDVVIHCAAMTAVDLCESKQFDAWRINAFRDDKCCESR